MERGALEPIIIPRLGDPADASIDDLDEHLLLLEAARQHLEIEWTETVAETDARSCHDLFGQPSTVAYLKARLRISGARAKRSVSLARLARCFAATFSAWKHRQISSDQAELMFAAAEKRPDQYSEAETVLLELSGESTEETRKVLDYWSSAVDRHALDANEQLRRRFFDYRRTSGGMVEGAFALPTLAGETLIAALDALLPPPAADDDRTLAQRRADALQDLARAFLDGSETSEVGGERPHLNILVDLGALDGVPGGLHETQTGQVIGLADLQQVACDAAISRVVFGPASEVLDVGRRSRIIPAGLRRAVIVRDRHCAFPGCTRSPRWCDVHHLLPWSEGGETEIGNLCLLCRYHHTLVHQELMFELMLVERLDLVGAQRGP